MSYSFSVVRTTKAEVLEAALAEFAKVVESQPVHTTDIEQAKAATSSLLDLITDDPARDVAANISGSIWQTEAGVQSLSLSVNVGFADRKATETTAG